MRIERIFCSHYIVIIDVRFRVHLRIVSREGCLAVSSMMTQEGILHYEVEGRRGDPLILLHCWLGSWRFWRGSMEYLARSRPYRIYALDFWGFGESDKRKETYEIRDYVSMVVQFMDEMGIQQAPLFGHSMGGTVAMSLALDYPLRVKQVAVVGSPMDGASLNILLKLAGQEWIARLLWRFPPLLNLVLWGFSPFVSTNQRDIYAQMIEHISQATMASFSRSIASLRHTDLRPRLHEIRIPVLAIYGTGDGVVDPQQAQVIAFYTPHARVEMMERSRHFPMLSEPERFNQVLASFLESPSDQREIAKKSSDRSTVG